MEVEDVLVGIGSVFSTILAGIFYVFEIPVFSIVFSMFTGAMITYFVQSKLQDRADKRKITRDKIEKIYLPIYNRLQEIKRDFVDDISYQPSLRTPSINGRFEPTTWQKIQNNPEFFSIQLDLRDEVHKTIELAEEINKSSSNVQQTIGLILLENGQTKLKKYYEEKGDMLSESHGSGYIRLMYEDVRKQRWGETDLIKNILLNVDSFNVLKQETKDIVDVQVFLRLFVYNKKLGRAEEVRISLSRVKEDLIQLVKDTKESMLEEKEIVEFLNKRQQLTEKIAKLIPLLRKHIEKNYPIEKIGAVD